VRAKARAIWGSGAGPSMGSMAKPLVRGLCQIEAKTIYFKNQVLIFWRFTALNLINKTSGSQKRTTKYAIIYEWYMRRSIYVSLTFKLPKLPTV